MLLHPFQSHAGMENEISVIIYLVPCHAQSKGAVRSNVLLVVAMVAVLVKKRKPIDREYQKSVEIPQGVNALPLSVLFSWIFFFY